MKGKGKNFTCVIAVDRMEERAGQLRRTWLALDGKTWVHAEDPQTVLTVVLSVKPRPRLTVASWEGGGGSSSVHSDEMRGA